VPLNTILNIELKDYWIGVRRETTSTPLPSSPKDNDSNSNDIDPNQKTKHLQKNTELHLNGN
jgi:hypothetical protein